MARAPLWLLFVSVHLPRYVIQHADNGSRAGVMTPKLRPIDREPLTLEALHCCVDLASSFSIVWLLTGPMIALEAAVDERAYIGGNSLLGSHVADSDDGDIEKVLGKHVAFNPEGRSIRPYIRRAAQRAVMERPNITFF